MSPPVLSVRNVSKSFKLPLDKSSTLKHRMVHFRSAGRYRQLMALEGVTFEVAEGEFVGIIGRNGSGKSTLLKILAGIYRPTSGEVTVNGGLSPFLELGVGFNPELTARENVLLNGAILGLSRRDLQSRLEEMIHFAELEQFVDTKLKNYSSGMQVRLAFTIAIQANAATLLMDEVLAVGDARFQAKCFDVFNRYRREGRTIILVTHDLGAVDLYADRAILLERGRVIEAGRATDVTVRYRRMIGQIEENERAASGGALIDVHDDRPSDSRWGTGAARVRSVAFLRVNGEPHVTFTTDEPMTIRIEVEAEAAMDDLVVGVGFHRADGTIVGGINTQMAQRKIPRLDVGERLTVDYQIPRLLILAGTYRASVALTNGSYSVTYDWIEQGFEFRVVDELGRPGSVELGGSWEIAMSRAGLADSAVADSVRR